MQSLHRESQTACAYLLPESHPQMLSSDANPSLAVKKASLDGEQTGSATQLLIIHSLKIVVVVLTYTSGTYKYVTPATFNIFALFQEN